MPGRHLSNEEKRLRDFWENPPRDLRRPLLRSVEIVGGDGLRGLDGVLVPFGYPITAVCGKNGSGKSTVLALAALAYHSPRDWYVHWTNTRYRRSSETTDRSYYIFPDFFFYDPTELIPNGVRLTWRHYWQGAEESVEFEKTAKQWGTYTRRPEREVDYAPLSRLLPGQELNAVRSTFSAKKAQAERVVLDEQYRGYFSYIMGTEYREAQILRAKHLTFANCRREVAYSGFNMGGGEYCVAQLLHLLFRLPSCGILIVEEIESCLHPEAQVRLAEVLVGITAQKNLQIVCSTHSEVFLDSLPREARVLLVRHGEVTRVVEEPSTRFAVYQMTGEVQPELTIYCEDTWAEMLIEEAVRYDDRTRLKVIQIGSNATVVRQGVSHLRGRFPGRCLCVLDGDSKKNHIDGWLRSETSGDDNLKPQIEVLPGDGVSPERWVLQQLSNEEYRREFARQLGCDLVEAGSHAAAMGAARDPHDMAATLSERTGFDRTECTRRIVRSVARSHPGLDGLRKCVGGLLD